MFKVNNKDNRTTLLTSFLLCLYSKPYIFHTLFYCHCCRLSPRKCQLGTGVMDLYLLQSRRRHRITVFIVNFVIVISLLILSIFLIAGFDILYFSPFQVKMNHSFIVYSFLEKFSTKWNEHPAASSSKQDMFIKNFNANCDRNFFVFFIL